MTTQMVQSGKFRIELLRSMMRVRMIEEEIAARYPSQRMRCPVHLSIGQEAVAVGVCAALRKSDSAMGTHRSHAHYLAKGGDLRSMIAELHGNHDGCSSGRGGSMHLIDLDANFLGSTPIVGGSIPVAVGVALNAQLNGRDEVTAIFFGDGATEEGSFFESLNFAAVKKLPIVFICENNLYSVYSALNVRWHSARNNIAIAKGLGSDANMGDGNSVDDVYRLSHAAVESARTGLGPTFLQFSTYRWREHCGPNFDNDLGYRSEAEYRTWQERCPIASYTKELISSSTMDEGSIAEMRSKIAIEISDVFAAVDATK